MSQKYEYKIGRWYPHDGGPCPVPGKTRVHVLWPKTGTDMHGDLKAGLEWDAEHPNLNWGDVVAFKVNEYPPQEKTRTHRCYVDKLSEWHYPRFVNCHSKEIDSNEGLCTVTTIDGKPTRIVWETDE